MLLIAILLASLTAALPGAPEEGSIEEKRKQDWNFTPDPDLPNVLILGDSISIGYTLKVRKELAGKANVYRPVSSDGSRPQNCSDTIRGLKRLDSWLGDQKWDVIHFNWGLHDLKHVKEAGQQINSSNPEDPQLSTVEEYSQRMEKILSRLQETGARLVFATTTPVVAGTTNPLREPEAPKIYNAAALKIMEADEIRVNDLHSYCEPHLAEWQLPKNVHFKKQGSEALGERVAAVIEEELMKAKKTSSKPAAK